MQDHWFLTLHDTLTGYTCESQQDIASITGWSIGMVGQILHEARRPEQAQRLGWSVPHVRRGPGPHLYQVVDGTQVLDADELHEVKGGAAGTLKSMASHGESEGHALRLAAAHLSPAQRRLVMQTVTASEGAAAMARHAAEVLEGAP